MKDAVSGPVADVVVNPQVNVQQRANLRNGGR